MKIINLDTCNSTQDYLKNQLEGCQTYSPFLVSSLEQTHGVGRRGTRWDTHPGSLAMSFTLEPNPTLTLTSLELGVLVSEFFKKYYQKKIFLKWPNDLISESQKKMGGIIAHTFNHYCIIGLGINLGPIPDHLEYNAASLQLNTSAHQLASEIYHFVLQHRLSSQETVETWTQRCSHLDKKIQWKNNLYIFEGIDKWGQARLRDTNQHSIKINSGSILIAP